MVSVNYRCLIYPLAFSSGWCIMGIELLAGRILAPYFGSSIHIWGSIITVFMLSLAAGYLLGGKLSLTSPSLTRYGSLFLISGLALLPIAFSGDIIMEWLFQHIIDSRYGSLAASIALFSIPTVIMGMISPYSVQLLVKNSAQSGHVAGQLYFVSTLGSAMGTIATSFYLVLLFEVNTIIFIYCLLMMLLGALVITYSKIRVRNGQQQLQ